MIIVRIFCIQTFVILLAFHYVSGNKDIMYRCANKECTGDIGIGVVRNDHTFKNGFTVRKQTQVVLLSEPIGKDRGDVIVRTMDSNVTGFIPYKFIERRGKLAKNINWTKYTETEILKVASLADKLKGSFKHDKEDKIQNTVIEGIQQDNISNESLDLNKQLISGREEISGSKVLNEELLEDDVYADVETEDIIPYVTKNDLIDELHGNNSLDEESPEKHPSNVEQAHETEIQIENETTKGREPADGILSQYVVGLRSGVKDSALDTEKENRENEQAPDEQLVNAHLAEPVEEYDTVANMENQSYGRINDAIDKEKNERTLRKEIPNLQPSQHTTDIDTVLNLENLLNDTEYAAPVSDHKDQGETIGEEESNIPNQEQHHAVEVHSNIVPKEDPINDTNDRPKREAAVERTLPNARISLHTSGNYVNYESNLENSESSITNSILDTAIQNKSEVVAENLTPATQPSSNDNVTVSNLETSESDIKSSVQDTTDQWQGEVIAENLPPVTQPLTNDNNTVPNLENPESDIKSSIQDTASQSQSAVVAESLTPITQPPTNDNDTVSNFENPASDIKDAPLVTDYKKDSAIDSFDVNQVRQPGSERDIRTYMEHFSIDANGGEVVADNEIGTKTIEEEVHLNTNLGNHVKEIEDYTVPSVENSLNDIKMYDTNYQIVGDAAVGEDSIITNLVQNFMEVDNVAALNMINSPNDVKEEIFDLDDTGGIEATVEDRLTDASYLPPIFHSGQHSDHIEDTSSSQGDIYNSEQTTKEEESFENVEAPVLIDVPSVEQENEANELGGDGIWNGIITSMDEAFSYVSFITNEFLSTFSHWWNYIFQTSNITEYEFSDSICRNENFIDAFGKRNSINCDEKISNYWINRDYMNFEDFERIISSDMFLLLLCTSITVLLFCFGYYFFERRKHDGVYVMKINELERELFIASKEVLIMEKKLNGKQELLQSESDDGIRISEIGPLQEENKKLMERTIFLEKELETVSSSAIEMHRLLELSLATQNEQDTTFEGFGSLKMQFDDICEKYETLKKSFEQLVMDNQFLKKDNENMKVTVEKTITENKILVKRNLEYMEKNRKYEEEMDKHDEKLLIANSEYKKETLSLKTKIDELELSIKKYNHENKQLKRILKGKKENDEPLFDKTQLKVQLSTTQAVNNDLSKELKEEKNARQLLEDHVGNLTQEVNNLRKNQESAERERTEAVTKLQVLSGYFKEKEEQFRKELENMQIIQNEYMNKDKSLSDKLTELRQQIDKLSEENDQLRKEIKDQELSYKTQLATEEQKSRDHWFSLRQVERKYKESQQEAANLRKKVVILENSLSNPTEKKSEGKLSNDNLGSSNGDISSGPPSLLLPPPPLSPDILPFSLRPDFIPPPLTDHSHAFMPPEPFYPIDQRLPPLGGRRVSSPPIPLPLEDDDDFLPPSPLYPIPRDRNISPPPPAQFSSTSRRDKERARNGRLSDNVGSQTSLESLNKSGR